MIVDVLCFVAVVNRGCGVVSHDDRTGCWVVGIGGGVGVLDGLDVVLCGKPIKSFLLFVLVAAFGLLCQINLVIACLSDLV